MKSPKEIQDSLNSKYAEYANNLNGLVSYLKGVNTYLPRVMAQANEILKDAEAMLELTKVMQEKGGEDENERR